FCAALVQQVVAEVSRVFQASWPKGPPRSLLLTAAVGMLPGLVPALQEYMEAWERLTAQGETGDGGDEEDFGAGLLDGGEHGELRSVAVLPPQAAARGA